MGCNQGNAETDHSRPALTSNRAKVISNCSSQGEGGGMWREVKSGRVEESAKLLIPVHLHMVLWQLNLIYQREKKSWVISSRAANSTILSIFLGLDLRGVKDPLHKCLIHLLKHQLQELPTKPFPGPVNPLQHCSSRRQVVLVLGWPTVAHQLGISVNTTQTQKTPPWVSWLPRLYLQTCPTYICKREKNVDQYIDLKAKIELRQQLITTDYKLSKKKKGCFGGGDYTLPLYTITMNSSRCDWSVDFQL